MFRKSKGDSAIRKRKIIYSTTISNATDRRRRIKSNNSGITLLELVASMALVGIIALVASNLLIHSTRINTEIIEKHEIFENGRISLDFTVNQMRIAYEFCVTHFNNPTPPYTNTLNNLNLLTDNTEDDHHYIINYNPRRNESGLRLNFGGKKNSLGGVTQELASGIENVAVIIDVEKDIMYITINSKVNGVWHKKSNAIDIRYKEQSNSRNW